MPLTDEQTAAIATLAAADPKEVADGLEQDAKGVFQKVFAVGFGKAKGDYENPGKTGKLDVALAEKATLTTERDEAKEEATRLAGKDADFSAEKTRLETALAAKSQEAKDAKDGAAKTVKDVYLDLKLAEVTAALVAKGVTPKYAKQIAPGELRSRIKVDVAEGAATPTISFLEADLATPLTSGLDGLVDSYFQTVDADWITSPVGGGSGTGKGGSGGGGGAATVADVKKAKAESGDYQL